MPTFICGCGHSGTSLLANMFASHPDVFIPHYETEIFLNPDGAAERWAWLETEARAAGKGHLAEKTPRHVHALELIRGIVPGARFVAMVRDGRDVAASFIKRTGSAASGRQRWLQDNAALLGAADAADVLIVRYEDLVAAPEAELRRICAFAGLPYRPEMLDYHRTPRLWFGVDSPEPGNGRDGPEHRRLRNWQINQPIFDDTGKWRRLLPPEEVAAFDAPELASLLGRFGYRAA